MSPLKIRSIGCLIGLIGSIILIVKAGWIVWIAIIVIITGNNIERLADREKEEAK